jgi:hypothetical protein
VLVYHDLLGLTEGRAPRFVKRYANIAEAIRRALSQYADEVRSGAYPADEHSYSMPEEELEIFSGMGIADGGREPARPDGGSASGASAEGVEHAHEER